MKRLPVIRIRLRKEIYASKWKYVLHCMSKRFSILLKHCSLERSKMRENIRQREMNVRGNVHSESKPGLQRLSRQRSHQSNALSDTPESYPMTSHSRNGPWIMKPIYLERLSLGRPFFCMWSEAVYGPGKHTSSHMALCIPPSRSTNYRTRCKKRCHWLHWSRLWFWKLLSTWQTFSLTHGWTSRCLVLVEEYKDTNTFKISEGHDAQGFYTSSRVHVFKCWRHYIQ